jgi:predicted nuclease of restriction endonuclease-like (RecB) superfamily
MELNTNYIEDIKAILLQARLKVYAAVNSAMVETYWRIGQRIVEEEQQGNERAAYGEAILKNLSIALSSEFGKGFSYANLRNFRQFYLTYPDQEICYAVRSNLTWTHHRLIMRVENASARVFYLKECDEQNWSTRTLERNINTLYYQRLLSSKHIETLPASDTPTLQDFIKDPYVFEFLGMEQPISASEKEIESALIQNFEDFLLELGKGFSFVGRQFRISTETSHFYIDLVFYNYILKCFVLFDLKADKLSHQDTGQMDMYIRMFDDLKKRADDNPTIGIILCAERDETVVKYSILKEHKQLFASKYMPYLPTEAELIAEIEREKIMIRQRLENQTGKAQDRETNKSTN